MENDDDTGDKGKDVVSIPVSPGENDDDTVHVDKGKAVEIGQGSVRTVSDVDKGKAVEIGERSVRTVSPGDSGDGLPYAPEHWPNNEDIWHWRVGKRFCKGTGFFLDRYLSLPKSLRKRGQPTEFQSRKAVEVYLKSNFPKASIPAFFKSFTWGIPIKPELLGTWRPQVKKLAVKTPEEVERSCDGEQTLAATGDGTRRALAKKLGVRRKQNGVKTQKGVDTSCDGEETHGEQTLAATGDGTWRAKLDVKRMQKEVETSCDREETLDGEQTLDASIFLATDDFNVSRGDPSPGDFDKYLIFLEEILSSPPSMEEDMSDLRKKISSLLAMGFPNLFLSSENMDELVTLSYKLQKDPSLSSEELHILELIQSIPFVCKSFLEAKEISSNVDEFLRVVNEKIASVPSLREEYEASKKEKEGNGSCKG